MSLLRLNRINRLFLVGWTVAALLIAVRHPTIGPLASVPNLGPLASFRPTQARYGVLAVAWLAGVGLTLAWQRTLWTTMGSGAGFATAGGVGLFRLPKMRASMRDRTVTVEAVRRGWSPLARLRVETAIDVDEPPVALELAVTTASDPDGRVLFEAPDADRRYVLESGGGNLKAFLTTDLKADLVEVDVPGVLRVEGTRASYELSYVPYDAGTLWTCAGTTVRLAERVERVAGGRRNA